MATNYTPPQFEGGFQGSAQSLGFNPEAAIDTSGQEAAKLKKIQEDDQVRARALERQQALDRGILQGKQTIENAQQDYKQAGARGNLALLKGLAGFSSTLSGVLLDESKKAEQRKEEAEQRAYEDSRIAQFGTGGLSDSFKQEIENNEITDYKITAEAQAIGDVSQQVSDQGEPGVAQQLNASSSYHQDGPRRRSAQQGLAMHGGWLLAKVNQLQVAGMTDEQIMAEVASLNSQFAAGVTGGDRRTLLKLADRMDANTTNAYSSIFARRAKEQNTAASIGEKDNIYSASLNLDMDQAYREAHAATANGGVDGKYGRSGQTKYRAVDGLLSNLAIRGDYEAIDRLRLVQGVPDQINTELGSDPKFARLFDKYYKDAVNANIADFDQGQRLQKKKISELSRLYLDKPTPKNKAFVVNAFREIGSAEALKAADQIMGVGLGINETLEAEIRLDAKSEKYRPRAELELLVAQGYISPEMLEYAEDKQDPGYKTADDYTKNFGASIEAGLTNNVYSELTGKRVAALSAEAAREFKPYIKNRATAFRQELNAKLGKIITSNGGGAEGLKAAQNAYNSVVSGMLEDERYRIISNSKGGFAGFGKDLYPGLKEIYVGKGESKQYSDFTPDKLKELRSSNMDAVQTTRDILIEKDALEADALAMANGQNVSARTAAVAEALGLSSRELVENQMRRYQMPTLSSLINQDYAAQRLSRIRSGSPPNTQESMAEFQAYGVPKKASLQLARIAQVNNPGSLPGISQSQRDVLNRIAAQESRGSGDYDALNKGSADAHGRIPVGVGTGTQNFGRPLTSMTVGEILQEGAAGNVHAAGRYQFIESTLRERVKNLNIPLDAKFDESMQDYLTLEYMKVNPKAWVGINDKDPGALGAMYAVASEPLPPAPWLNPEVSPQQLMDGIRRTDARSYNTIMNPHSSPNQVRAAIISSLGRQAGSISSAPKKVYTTGNLGYGSTGDHVDIKPVSPGQILANRSLPMTRTELDRYVAVATNGGLTPISQAMKVTSSDAQHRARGSSSHGIDFAAEPNRELYLTNGARVIENYHLPDAAAEGSHRLLIEVPGGKRYAFLHGTSQIRPTK